MEPFTITPEAKDVILPPTKIPLPSSSSDSSVIEPFTIIPHLEDVILPPIYTPPIIESIIFIAAPELDVTLSACMPGPEAHMMSPADIPRLAPLIELVTYIPSPDVDVTLPAYIPRSAPLMEPLTDIPMLEDVILPHT